MTALFGDSDRVSGGRQSALLNLQEVIFDGGEQTEPGLLDNVDCPCRGAIGKASSKGIDVVEGGIDGMKGQLLKVLDLLDNVGDKGSVIKAVD